ncbi:MAG: hypothetical protein N2376_11575, partial [Clostridia bacterium]|nr:hypothetical protein [Clostridia bacterium]
MHRDNVRKLSDYIERRASERKAKEPRTARRGLREDRPYNALKSVRRRNLTGLPERSSCESFLREPGLRLSSQTAVQNSRKASSIGFMALSSVILLIVVLIAVSPLGRPNLVGAMEKAYQDMRPYHGILEIRALNVRGETPNRTKLEVWADNKGRYCVKELEGPQNGLVTVNNGERKWQLVPGDKKAYLFSESDEPYGFTFNMVSEIKNARNARHILAGGELTVAGRRARVFSVTQSDGVGYTLWVD